MKQRLIRYFAIPFIVTVFALGGALVTAQIVGPLPPFPGCGTPIETCVVILN